MKKLILTLIVAFATLCGIAQDGDLVNPGFYEIKGKVKNVPDGTVLCLMRFNTDYGVVVGNDTISNGEFYFKLVAESDDCEKLALGGFMNEGFSMLVTTLWASAGDCVLVEGEDKLMYTWKVTGPAPENTVLARYIKKSFEEWKCYESLSAEARSLSAKGNKDERAVECIQRINGELDSLKLRICANDLSIMKQTVVDDIWMDRFYFATLCMQNIKDFTYTDELRQLYGGLTTEQRSHYLAKKAYVNLYPQEQAQSGKKAIDGEMIDLDGKKHTLAELKGKYILLDFWANGCGPCVKALPELAVVARMYKDKLCVVSVNLESEEVWREALKEHPVSWYNWNDGYNGSALYARYRSDRDGIPLFVLISPDGYILEQWCGYGEGVILEHLSGTVE